MLVWYKVLLGIIHHFGFATSFSFGLWLSDIFLKIHLHYCIWLATFASSFSLTKITENPKTSSKFQLMAKCFFFVFYFFIFFYQTFLAMNFIILWLEVHCSITTRTSSTSSLISFYTASGNPNLIMFLAANKADLEEKRKVGVEV